MAEVAGWLIALVRPLALDTVVVSAALGVAGLILGGFEMVNRHHPRPGWRRTGLGRRADGPRTAGDDSCLHPAHCGRSREGPRLATSRPLIAVYGRFPAYSGRTPLGD
jgi:hypothetical protein